MGHNALVEGLDNWGLEELGVGIVGRQGVGFRGLGCVRASTTNGAFY